jgi:hypothetical protein
MALGLSSGGSGGEIRPYVKYDAKAGRMFRIDRVQGSDGQYQTDQVEITNTVQFVADLANIRVGWINYTAQGPIRKLVVLGKEPIPARPDDKNSEGKLAFKQGFELDILLNKDSGGGPSRILGSAAGCVIDAMDELHDAYSAAPEPKAGKLPVVKIASVSPVKSGQSTNYKPIFQIVSWVDRPAALAFEESIRAANSAPPATGSTVAPPPPPQVPQPAASASDFG